VTSPGAEPRVARLVHALRVGLGAAEDSVRTELGLAAETDDRDVAHTLVQILSACHAGVLHGGPVAGERAPEHEVEWPPPSTGALADSSFMGQVMAPGRSTIVVDEMTDVSTLLALGRGGTLQQRRAALGRLGRLLDERALSGEPLRAAIDGVSENRDVALTYELLAVRARLPGRSGRGARTERETWERLVQQLEADVQRFWDGQQDAEPLAQLAGADRAQVLLRARDLPDTLVAHVSALAEGTDGLLGPQQRRDVLAALHPAADPRLVPALVYVLQSGTDALVKEAARALGRIDDPRVVPALRQAYERSAAEDTHLVIAGALGVAGDTRGAPEVSEIFARDDDSLALFVLEALESLGKPEHGDAVCHYLDSADPALRARAQRTLGRIADGRVLAAMEARRRATQVSAERAELEEAMDAIAARMELRGEEAIVPDPGETRDAAPSEGGSRAPFRQRLRAYWNHVVGTLWLALGAVARATARFEFASLQRPGWSQPLVSMGLAFVRRREHAQALNAFRRALTADRQRVERNPLVVGPVARAFLRRAEEVERDGRHDIARGLVAEALALDLRRAPSEVRFELQRLSESLGRRLAE
jgi:HEAT repeat protein